MVEPDTEVEYPHHDKMGMVSSVTRLRRPVLVGRYKVSFRDEIGIWYLKVGSGISLIVQP
jgi:hypothetical protein